MLTHIEFTTTLNEYSDLFADDEMYEYLKESFDELESFSTEDLAIFFSLLTENSQGVNENFREAIANHKLTLEEGVELANKMYLLEGDDKKEVAFVKKMYMDDGVTLDGIYKDVEDYARHYISAYLELDNLPGIESFIDYKSCGEWALNSCDFDTDEFNGRLFVFRR